MQLWNGIPARGIRGMILTGLLVGSTWALHAQLQKLDYQQVFENQGPELLADLPQIEEWLDGERYLEFRMQQGEPLIMAVEAKNGREKVHQNLAELGKGLPEAFSLRQAVRSEDQSGYLFERQGELYYFHVPSNTFRQLTYTEAEEHNPRFSPDGKKVAFTRQHNLYVVDVESGEERALTTDGNEQVYNGWASWVYMEEILGRRSRNAAFWWSPYSDKIAYLRFDDRRVPQFPIYRADGVHEELEIQRYPKAGDPSPEVTLGVVEISNSRTTWIDINENLEYTAWPYWRPDGKALYFQQMNRDQDYLVMYAADPSTGEKAKVYEESQPTWVTFFRDLYFFQDLRGFLLRSDRSGWSHFYVYDLEGKQGRPLTRGDWEASQLVQVDEVNNWLFFLGRKDNTLDTHLFRVNLDGTGLKQLTRAPGTHRCVIAPEGNYLIDTYSSLDHPAKIDLLDSEGKLIRTLGDSRSTDMTQYAWGQPAMFTIPSGDGFDLPAMWILPPDFDSTRRYPVIFNVYGGPGSASVRNRWPGLNPHYLAQQGAIVVSVDHRGSGHFGKKGMDFMHRNLGKWEMHDLMAAAAWLKEKPFVDPGRIGITGGSYGGFTTTMALTYGARHFTHGVARAAVTDWRLYDNVYTERYMDHPTDNPAGYAQGSVMKYADQLEGKLLIIHGTADDNVHMQNSLQLIDALTDLNKSFEMMVYPDERHGIRSRNKRYHQNRLVMKFWFEHLLEKPLPPDLPALRDPRN